MSISVESSCRVLTGHLLRFTSSYQCSTVLSRLHCAQRISGTSASSKLLPQSDHQPRPQRLLSSTTFKLGQPLDSPKKWNKLAIESRPAINLATIYQPRIVPEFPKPPTELRPKIWKLALPPVSLRYWPRTTSPFTIPAPLPKYYVFVETPVKQSSTSTLIASALNSRNVEFGPTFLSHLVPK